MQIMLFLFHLERNGNRTFWPVLERFIQVTVAVSRRLHIETVISDFFQLVSLIVKEKLL
jgi:hypothetical protein